MSLDYYQTNRIIFYYQYNTEYLFIGEKIQNHENFAPTLIKIHM